MAAWASPSRPAGSTMRGAVMVMFPSRDLWKVNSRDHAVAASRSEVHAGEELDDRATPLSEAESLLHCTGDHPGPEVGRA